MNAIDIFISRPSTIANEFESPYCSFERYLKRSGLCLRRLGGDRYTLDAPLKGVMDLMKVCRGAIILGYPQYEMVGSILKVAQRRKNFLWFFRHHGIRLRQH